MTADFARDAAGTAAAFGFFASAWFGWAQEDPPDAWRRPLVAGSVLSLLIAAAGAVLAWRHWSDGTAFNADTSRAFGIIVGIEFAVAALGAVVLARLRRSDLTPAWIALVVGVHLFPLAPLLRYPLLTPVAVLVTVAALTVVPLTRSKSLAVSAGVGVATGTILLATALLSLVTVIA
jgi:hypothetical protein